ncbi:hypothetical protein [uncultured Roseovarius sp.]|uniref:hypothetical protein n=1 Tax=uncultured Roseovarius sp. TaxID=293344 RepID=UPI0025970478|nr:hypothetical protein [uncultured Roseovarius sp.]
MTYTRHTFRQISISELERLLHHMPAVAVHAENEWAQRFAQSIIRQSKRRRWQPSQKQLNVMRSLVSDLFAHGDNSGGDIELIED